MQTNLSMITQADNLYRKLSKYASKESKNCRLSDMMDRSLRRCLLRRLLVYAPEYAEADLQYNASLPMPSVDRSISAIIDVQCILFAKRNNKDFIHSVAIMKYYSVYLRMLLDWSY